MRAGALTTASVGTEGDVEAASTTLALDRDRHRVAGFVAPHRLGELLVGADGVAVQLHHDVTHLRRLYPRHSTDVDLYKFTTPNTTGTFSATLGGRTMTGSLSRTLDDAGNARLEADVTNIDFAAILPFIDDATSVAALRHVTHVWQSGRLTVRPM